MIDPHGSVVAPGPVVPVKATDMGRWPEGLQGLKKVPPEGGWALRGASLHLAGGLEAAPNRPGSCPAGLSPNIPAPPHNRQRPKRGRKRRCNAALPALRRRGARPLAGADTNKATFPASPPASPRTSPVPPLGALPSRTRTPAVGESAVDRQAGRASSAPHATQSGEGAGHEQGEKTGANVWDACNPLAHAGAL